MVSYRSHNPYIIALANPLSMSHPCALCHHQNTFKSLKILKSWNHDIYPKNYMHQSPQMEHSIDTIMWHWLAPRQTIQNYTPQFPEEPTQNCVDDVLPSNSPLCHSQAALWCGNLHNVDSLEINILVFHVALGHCHGYHLDKKYKSFLESQDYHNKNILYHSGDQVHHMKRLSTT